MEIERINENTVKFYISYVDIENRGFEREEIWYNRERSEQLFWQMMEEVNYKEDFPLEGPLWIQVQALDKGLEIIVTKAQISNGDPLESIEDVDDLIDLSFSATGSEETESELEDNNVANTGQKRKIKLISEFIDFDSVIGLSHYFQEKNEDDMETVLYHYQDKYYLCTEVHSSVYDIQEDIFSQILEYSHEVRVTSHVLEEYGEKVIDGDVFSTIRNYF